jgi:hypothetical protein
MNISDLAPCGMNCATCLAYLREKNTCCGCRSDKVADSRYIRKCSIRNCAIFEKTDSTFCFECDVFPCKRLKQLDKRYKTRYTLSFLDNLQQIKSKGTDEFLKSERLKWHCNTCGGTVCVHRDYCLKCYNLKDNKRKARISSPT